MNKTTTQFRRESRNRERYNLLNTFDEYCKRTEHCKTVNINPEGSNGYRSIRSKRKSHTTHTVKFRMLTENAFIDHKHIVKRKMAKAPN